jgi:hypothetical protein
VRRCGGVLAAALLVTLLPACSPSCGGDRAGPVNSLATAERWVRVVDIVEPPGGAGTNVIDLEVVAVDASQREGAVHTGSVAVHSDFMDGMTEGLADGGDVFLGLASKGLEREQVAYVIVRGVDGAHHLVGGDCAASDEAFLRDQLGDRFEATMEALIGVSEVPRIRALLEDAGLTVDR